MLLFVLGSTSSTNVGSYLTPLLDGNELLLFNALTIQEQPAINRLVIFDKYKLFYHINRLTDIHHLCIPLFVTPIIVIIAHKKSHLSFACYYMILT